MILPRSKVRQRLTGWARDADFQLVHLAIDALSADAIIGRPSARGLLCDSFATKQRQQSAGHGCDQFFIPFLCCKCLRVTNGDCSTGLQDARPEQKMVASGGSDKVSLEFD